MRLPKWLWRLLRSKRFHRLLIIAPFVAIIGVVVFYWGVNRWGQAKLDATRERMRGLGIPLSEAELESRTPPGRGKLTDEFTRLSITPYGTDGSTILRNAEVPNPRDWFDFLRGTETQRAGDIRILFPNGPEDLDERELARGVLRALEKLRPNVQKALELVQDPDWELPWEYRSDSYNLYQTVTNLGFLLTLRAALHHAAGDPAAALRDYFAVLDLSRRLQFGHRPLLQNIQSLGLLATLYEFTPSLVESSRSDPAILTEIDAGLRSVDSLAPTLMAFETDLGSLVSRTVSELGHGTCLPASEMRWATDWMGDLDEWKDTLSGWWWQVRPVGFTKADVSGTIEAYLHHMTRRPDGAIRTELTLEDTQRCHSARKSYELTEFYFGIMGIDRVVVSAMHSVLQNRVQQVIIAAELHRLRTGSFPETARDLAIELPSSPFTGTPIRLSKLPDGRLEIRSPSADPDDPYQLEYPPKP